MLIFLGVCLAVLAIGALLYGLHRGSLWLEEQGYIYYLKKKPSGGRGGSLVALQRALDPSSQHVQQVSQHRNREGEDPEGDDHRRFNPPRIDRHER